jgi:hypothetical protein
MDRRSMALMVIVVLLATAGCASIQKSEAMDNERTLAAANFQMMFATTPALMAKAEALPQRKLTPVPGPDGKNRFVYADAEFCKCIYVGTEEAYDRYQKLSVKKQIAENEEAASMDWDAWGGWGPYY